MLTRRSALAAIGAAAVAPRVHATPRLAYELVPKQVASGIWMIEGATEYFTMQNGGAIVNVVLLQGQSGLLLVDSGPSRRYGEALAEAAKALDSRGIVALVNTHHHPDHFFGNQVFADVPIYALGETRAAAQADGDAFSDNMYRLLGDWMRGTEVVPPTAVVSGGDLQIDGRVFEALPLSGHTVADLALLDRETGTLIAGDIAFLDRAPTTPSADLALWKTSLSELERVDAATVIPGHGPADRAGRAVAQTRAYLEWLEAALKRAAGDGLDMVEVMDLPLPPEFAAMGAQPKEFQRSVAHLFPDIETEVLPLGN